MSDTLPEGWSIKPLRELAQVVSGGTPSRNVPYFWDDGAIPWVTPTDITATQGKYISDSKDKITKLGLMGCSASLLPSGSILMTSRATLGEAKISAMPTCTNQGFKSLVAKPGVSNEFLYYQIQRTKHQYARFGSGSTFLEVGKKDTEAFPVMIPDEDKQAKIAELLSLLDAQIEAVEALIAKQERVRAGLMQDLFTRGVDEHGQLRPPREQAPHLYHLNELGWLPLGWDVGNLIDYTAEGGNVFVNGPFGSDLLSSELKAEGVPVIYVRDISNEEYDRVSTVCVTQSKANQLAFCSVKRGDLLVAKVGDPPCMAAPYTLDDPAIVTQDVMRLRPAKSGDHIFLASLLNSGFGVSAIRRIIVEGTRSRVSLTEFKKLRVPMPPVDEREKIGAAIASILKLSHSYKVELENLRLQKSGLMQALLTGKLSVAPLLERAAA